MIKYTIRGSILPLSNCLEFVEISFWCSVCLGKISRSSTMRFTSCMRYIICMMTFYWHALSGLQNFALRKTAYQSSTENYNNFAWTADKAVDGNTDGRNPDTSRTCSETDIRMGNHTWEVDIGFMFIVKNVVIYERSDGQDQLSGFLVILGNHSNPWRNNPKLRRRKSTLYKHICFADDFVARFVSVIRPNKDTMTLCEVEVYGECLDGTYSEFCNRTCGKCSSGDPCNKDTGECLRGCKPGWTGLLCDKECAKGTYGSGCTYTCGQCLNGNETCSASDGRCSMGCREGWQGDTCKTNSSTKATQTLPRADLTVIGGSVAGVCVGAIIIIIIIIAVLKRRSRSIDTGDPEMIMNTTGVKRKKTFGYSATEDIMRPSYCNVASLCRPTTTASMEDSAYSQITEAKYEMTRLIIMKSDCIHHKAYNVI
ncbi:hypothetical protein ACJMK2_031637 [Sinanodonta woodiana]|uniref:Fucolectin tachylectin-4 pentraxin-1 domain-containing protein n=1 Tax=Sinanodonta woodiana TaxID=1069815 RepID=A0ABD3X2U4_SINWO